MFQNQILSSISRSSFENSGSVVRLISPKKWKKSMFNIINIMKEEFAQHHRLLSDFDTIVQNITEDKLIEATLSIRPFKPQFLETSPMLSGDYQSTMAETMIKMVRQKEVKKQKERGKVTFLTQKTLTKQFNEKYHPYRFIVKNFSLLLELKAKSKQLEGKQIDFIKEELVKDIKILSIFLERISEPYYILFQTSSEEKVKIEKKFKAFISQFVYQHDSIIDSVRKIIKYHSRKLKEEAKNKLEDFADPKSFSLHKDFEIDGCYIRSLNTLMQFSQACDPMVMMEKLKEFRTNILVDIDTYYKQIANEPKQLELDAENQLEIIKFIVTKLKNWSCEIYGSLKFLEVILGEEEITYKYDGASFIYTQLIGVFSLLSFQ